MDKANATEMVVSAKSKTTEFMKSRMFDVIAVAIVIAMLALSLGVLQLRQITVKEIFNITVETLPFYFAMLMLNDNYYMKGTYAGKSTKAFKSIVNAYSTIVNALTGRQIKMLPDFCEGYNQATLEKMQLAVLRDEALTLKDFNEDYVETVNDEQISHGPLKAMSRHELVHLIGEHRAKAVIRAKKIKIKGISSNILLGSSDDIDITNLGPGEKQMHSRRRGNYAFTSFVTMLILTLISVRDVTSWGWVGIMFVIFKLLYIVARSYMKYFEGYQDITISLANHLSRKTDIIKEFSAEYPDKSINENA